MQDRQESAEKIAGDLAVQLKAVHLEKGALERRNLQLEQALAGRGSDAGLAGAPATPEATMVAQEVGLHTCNSVAAVIACRWWGLGDVGGGCTCTWHSFAAIGCFVMLGLKSNNQASS